MIKNGELYFLNHASLLIRYDDNYYWTDPWIISPAFGAWLQEPSISASVFKFIDTIPAKQLFIVISHGHDDHCDDFILKARFADAQYVIPEYKSKGFLRRIQNIGTREVIEVSEKPSRIGSLEISSFINPDFTGNDASLFISTKEFCLVHANDNWHLQPAAFFAKAQIHCKKSVYYFSQIGIADCFPRNYPQFSDPEYLDLINSRLNHAYSLVQENGRRLEFANVYAYANQSVIATQTTRPLHTNISAVTAIGEHDPRSPRITQMLPDYKLDLFTGNLDKASFNPNNERYFQSILKVLERESKAHITKVMQNNNLALSFDIVFLTCEELTEITNNVTDLDVTVYLVAPQLIWSRILSADLNLEAIIIGGCGEIYRYPKTFNISAIHRALSEFSYIAQAKLKNGLLSL